MRAMVPVFIDYTHCEWIRGPCWTCGSMIPDRVLRHVDLNMRAVLCHACWSDPIPHLIGDD